jgi:PEP-CTERM motif-containing protein
MNCKVCFAALVVVLMVGSSAFAATITLAFDAAQPEGPTYTEQGVTITKAAGSTSGVLVEGGAWNVPCCPNPDLDAYDVTTVYLSFDLLSINILHSDAGDPITFTGYAGASLVNSDVVDADDFGLKNFAGFTNLTRLEIVVTGDLTDPTFDDLKISPIPEPSTYVLIGLGLSMIALLRRRSIRIND